MAEVAARSGALETARVEGHSGQGAPHEMTLEGRTTTALPPGPQGGAEAAWLSLLLTTSAGWVASGDRKRRGWAAEHPWCRGPLRRPEVLERSGVAEMLGARRRAGRPRPGRVPAVGSAAACRRQGCTSPRAPRGAPRARPRPPAASAPSEPAAFASTRGRILSHALIGVTFALRAGRRRPPFALRTRRPSTPPRAFRRGRSRPPGPLRHHRPGR